MMKTKLLTLICICFLLPGSFTACDSDTDPLPFTEYSLNSSQYWILDYEGNGNVLVVNNDEKLKKIFTDVEYPHIDFSKYTLVLVSGTTNYGIDKKTMKSVQKLSTHKYKLNIEISLTVATIMEPWVFPVLIDKINDKSVVEANVTIL